MHKVHGLSPLKLIYNLQVVIVTFSPSFSICFPISDDDFDHDQLEILHFVIGINCIVFIYISNT